MVSDPPKGRLILFSMAYHSGMGRFASEMAKAAFSLSESLQRKVIFIAPPMEYEPEGIERVFLTRPKGKGRLQKLISLARFNQEATYKTRATVQSGDIFVMIDLYSTVPFSVNPALAARENGAITILNLHDFYPHALRYPKPLHALEKRFYLKAYQSFDLVAATAAPQALRLTQEARISPECVLVIQHGAFPIDHINLPKDDQSAIRVLVLGSLRQNKKILETILAIKLLQNKGHEIILRIAGAPRREEADYWAICLAELESAGNLELIDRYIPDEEMPQILSEVDVILCPYENFDSQSAISITAVSNAIPLLASPEALVKDVGDKITVKPIATPITPETIMSAINIFVATPRLERLAAARKLQTEFMAKSHWSQAIQSIVGKAEELKS
jgi:glycosyltransferase involved in cell wall biosynthesis